MPKTRTACLRSSRDSTAGEAPLTYRCMRRSVLGKGLLRHGAELKVSKTPLQDDGNMFASAKEFE